MSQCWCSGKIASLPQPACHQGRAGRLGNGKLVETKIVESYRFTPGEEPLGIPDYEPVEIPVEQPVEIPADTPPEFGAGGG